MMGTSVAMLDKTYGHLLRDAATRGRGQLDAFDATEKGGFGRLSGATEQAFAHRKDKKRPSKRGFFTIGAPRFELGTSCPPDKRANQAAPRPVEAQSTAE